MSNMNGVRSEIWYKRIHLKVSKAWRVIGMAWMFCTIGFYVFWKNNYFLLCIVNNEWMLSDETYMKSHVAWSNSRDALLSGVRSRGYEIKWNPLPSRRWCWLLSAADADEWVGLYKVICRSFYVKGLVWFDCLVLSGFEKIIIFYVCLVYIWSMKFMYRLYEFYEMLCWSGGLEIWRVYWKRLIWIPESGEGYYWCAVS